MVACFIRIESPLRNLIAIKRIRGRHLVVVTHHAVSLECILDDLFAWNTIFQRLPEIMITGWLTVTHHRQVGVSSGSRRNDFDSRCALYQINQVSIHFGGDVVLTRHHRIHACGTVDVGDPLQSVKITITPVVGISLNTRVDPYLVLFHDEPASP